MTGRPARIAQTSTEAKRLHRRNNGGLSERQQRQLERDAELENRAQRLREADERRKAAKKKREIREKREAEARKQAGVGLATQLIGYSCTQAQLKSGMEAFLGIKKKQQEERRKELEVSKCLESVIEADLREPWDDDEFDLPDLAAPCDEQWIEEALDDDTLLQVHDKVVSDSVDETKDYRQPCVPCLPGPQPRINPSKESAGFIRLHGPVHKAVEEILDTLPDPLVELLSQDSPVDATIWNPASSLLHKLNPPGLPPHRLRIKVGCVVTLLRVLKDNSQPLESQHLRVLQKERDRLECLVLDGPLEGTKTFLTRIPFTAYHRNDETCAYKRVQFPIHVSKDWPPSGTARDSTRSTFKVPSIPMQRSRPSISVTRSEALPTSAPDVVVAKAGTPFKKPDAPASKAKSKALVEAQEPPPCLLLDGWDAFLDTGTQIARELSSEPSSSTNPPPRSSPARSALTMHPMPPLSTSDLDFAVDDLDGLVEAKPTRSDPRPVNVAKSTPPCEANQHLTHALPTLHKKSPFPRTEHPLSSKQRTVTPNAQVLRPLKRKLAETLVANAPTSAKKAAIDSPALHVAAPADSSHAVVAPAVVGAPLSSFCEFGMSTQEALSFFDDDEELVFGSPPIAV